MRSLLAPQDYCSEAVFLRERERIFKRTWLLAALRPMVARHLQFRTVELAGIPLVVQNFHGTVRAFENICRHRLGRIQWADFGSRPLSCPYHHWSYDQHGALAGVPRNDSLFQLSDAQKGELKLRQFPVETVGGLIFVNLGGAPPLREQFRPELLELLAASTDRMDDEFMHTHYMAEFNWKTGIENIKDSWHVHCLHGASFPESISIEHQFSGIAAVNHEAPPLQRLSLVDASAYYDAPIAANAGHDWQALVERVDSAGAYRGFHLFPNVNLMVVDGSSFSVQIYNPVAPGRTEMQMSVALTRPTEPFGHKPVVLWEHLKSDMKVLNEDIACLEAMQPNFAAAAGPVMHGAYEGGIMEFHAAYRTLLAEQAA